MKNLEINLTSHKTEAFDGFNQFILIQQNRIDTNKKNGSLFITNMEGEIIAKLIVGNWTTPGIPAQPAKFINSTTILLGTQGGAVLWNVYDNTTVATGFWGHHEYEYNPLNNTVFTFKEYNVEIAGTLHKLDTIVEYNTTGHVVWTLNVNSFISHTQWCPFRDMVKSQSGLIIDLLHSNSLFFDTKEDVLYYHARNLNTFYKILRTMTSCFMTSNSPIGYNAITWAVKT